MSDTPNDKPGADLAEGQDYPDPIGGEPAHDVDNHPEDDPQRANPDDTSATEAGDGSPVAPFEHG